MSVGTTESTELRRSIGRRVLVLFVVGDILGAGIYALTGKVAAEVGGMVWLPFACAFVLATLTATAYAELVGRYPKAAGAARAFGGDYLAELVTVPTLVAAWAFLLVVTGVNLLGISESVRVNVVLTVVEATGLLVILAIGGWALVTGDGDPSRAFVLETDGPAWMAVLGATALAFYALLGFEDSVNLAEECRAPRRDFPRALFGGLAIAGLIYLGVAFTSSMLVETDVLAESTGPLLEVVKVAGLTVPPALFAVVALLAVSNTALINMLMASRLVYGMAQERIVPRVLGRVGRRQTPHVAIAFTVAVALTLVSTGDLAGLADTTVLLLLLVFATVNVSVLVLRRRPADEDGADAAGGPDRTRTYRAPTWAPAAGAVVSLVLASPFTGRDPAVYVRAGVLLAVGVVLYLVNRWVLARSDERVGDASHD